MAQISSLPRYMYIIKQPLGMSTQRNIGKIQSNRHREKFNVHCTVQRDVLFIEKEHSRDQGDTPLFSLLEVDFIIAIVKERSSHQQTMGEPIDCSRGVRPSH